MPKQEQRGSKTPKMPIFDGFCLLTRKLIFFHPILRLFLGSTGPIGPPKVHFEVFPTAKQSEPGWVDFTTACTCTSLHKYTSVKILRNFIQAQAQDKPKSLVLSCRVQCSALVVTAFICRCSCGDVDYRLWSCCFYVWVRLRFWYECVFKSLFNLTIS